MEDLGILGDFPFSGWSEDPRDLGQTVWSCASTHSPTLYKAGHHFPAIDDKALFTLRSARPAPGAALLREQPRHCPPAAHQAGL